MDTIGILSILVLCAGPFLCMVAFYWLMGGLFVSLFNTLKKL